MLGAKSKTTIWKVKGWTPQGHQHGFIAKAPALDWDTFGSKCLTDLLRHGFAFLVSKMGAMVVTVWCVAFQVR